MLYLYKFCIVLLIIVTLPIYIVISISILLTTGFPVFFLQKRIGKGGKEFTIFKFRTMILNAHDLQSDLIHLNEAHGPVFKITEDPRFTKVGRFINHTGLDELPQLWNVFFGTMALIGPRPLPTSEAKKLKQWQKAREKILPGIISPWVLEGYHSTPFNEWMKSDIAYVEKKSFFMTCTCFLDFLYTGFHLLRKRLLERYNNGVCQNERSNQRKKDGLEPMDFVKE